MNSHKNNNHGFTLIELMISLSVIAALLVIAAPSWKTQTAKNRLVTTTNKMIGALAYTRSEAVKQGTQATLCTSNDQSNASPSCTASAWQDGWLVWADLDRDGSLDSPTEIVRMSEPLKGNVAITAGSTTFAFDSTGFTSTPSIFKICDDRIGNHGREIRLLVSGSSALTTGVACP